MRGYLLGWASAQRTLPVSDPADVLVSTYRPDIVEDKLKSWATANGQPAPQFADIPGVYDYANVVSAKFLGGEKLDMLYSHTDQLNRWQKAGWIRDDLDSIDWVQVLKPKLAPWGVENMSTFDGKLAVLANWAGSKYLVHNDLHFEKARSRRGAAPGDRVIALPYAQTREIVRRYPVVTIGTHPEHIAVGLPAPHAANARVREIPGRRGCRTHL